MWLLTPRPIALKPFKRTLGDNSFQLFQGWGSTSRLPMSMGAHTHPPWGGGVSDPLETCSSAPTPRMSMLPYQLWSLYVKPFGRKCRGPKIFFETLAGGHSPWYGGGGVAHLETHPCLHVLLKCRNVDRVRFPGCENQCSNRLDL